MHTGLHMVSCYLTEILKMIRIALLNLGLRLVQPDYSTGIVKLDPFGWNDVVESSTFERYGNL